MHPIKFMMWDNIKCAEVDWDTATAKFYDFNGNLLKKKF